MQRKVIEVVCDNCMKTIKHYIPVSNLSVDNAIEFDGGVAANGKHFCGKPCQAEFDFTHEP